MAPLAVVLIVIAVLVGAMVPAQAGINATLARVLGNPLLAALTNMSLATLLAIASVIALRVPLPTLEQLGAAPWWSWSGGLFGALLVLSAILLAPRLGATAFMSATIVGTMVASLLIDHFGLIGFREHPINTWRFLGGALVVVGMLLVQRN